MIEGPGHVPMTRSRRTSAGGGVCGEAPFYTLGPLATDIAPALRPHHERHRAAIIAQHGTAMLCYVTPRSPRLPNRDDVKSA